jgi:hypothetical protein
MKFIKITFILMMLVFFSRQNVLACSCYPPPPPCYAYSESEVVFVGTVKEVKVDYGSFPPKKIRIAINKNYKGINSNEVLAEIGNSSCDFEGYRENAKFLFYGGLYESQTKFGTSSCSRSQYFDENSTDFEFLNALNKTSPNYWIWGTFTKGYRGSQVKGIKAEVIDGKITRSGISDNTGTLKFTVAKEGKYKVRVYLPKDKIFRPSDYDGQWNLVKGSGKNKRGRYVEYEVEVKNNQCGWFDAVFTDKE